MRDLAIGYYTDDAGGETNVHQVDLEAGWQFVQAYKACDVVTLQIKCYRDWKEPLVVAAKDFMMLVEKWLGDQNLTILPCVDRSNMRCPKCGKEMVGLGNVFIEWGKSSGDEYEEEGNADTFVCECGFQMADLQHFDLDEDKVVLQLDDCDFHGFACKCGKCDQNGRSRGVCIRHRGSSECDVERVYGPSPEAAMHNARLRCRELGLTIKE